MILGIEIGGTKLQLVLGDADGTIRQRFRFKVAREAAAEGIRRKIAETVASIRSTESLDAVGVGFGGPVNHATGRIARSHQIEGWSDFDLAGWMRGQVECPVFVDNDANVAALGEALLGAGRGADPVFYTTLGSGVGGEYHRAGRALHGLVGRTNEAVDHQLLRIGLLRGLVVFLLGHGRADAEDEGQPRREPRESSLSHVHLPACACMPKPRIIATDATKRNDVADI